MQFSCPRARPYKSPALALCGAHSILARRLALALLLPCLSTALPSLSFPSPGRLDLRNVAAMDDPAHFGDPSLNAGTAAWDPLVRAVLGDGAALLWKGLVVTEPGALQQDYHPDGPPVSEAEWAAHEALPTSAGGLPVDLPAHSLTVFVPLVDLSTLDGARAGPTSFLPGTHNAPALRAIEQELRMPGSSGGAGLPAVLDVSAGDAIIFNSRLRHAGSANRSTRRRPLLYLVYGREWYSVAMHTRLLEEMGLAVPGARLEQLVPLREDAGERVA